MVEVPSEEREEMNPPNKKMDLGTCGEFYGASMGTTTTFHIWDCVLDDAWWGTGNHEDGWHVYCNRRTYESFREKK